MPTPSLFPICAASQAQSRLVEMLREKKPWVVEQLSDLDFEQLADKNLVALIPALQKRNLLVSLVCEKTDPTCLPVERITVAGALLVRALVAGPAETRAFGDLLAVQPHDRVPMAVCKHWRGAHAQGLDVLQLVAQWRWRGQASPLAIDRDLALVAAALQRHAVDGLSQDLGRVAAWCVTHDWGTGLEARQGQTATRCFLALLNAGAVVPGVDGLAFPDAVDALGRLPVLLAVIRHAAPPQLAPWVHALLVQGANPDAACAQGRTALMACTDRRLGVHGGQAAKHLLAHGAKPGLRNKNGLTALDQMAAAARRQSAMVQRIVPLATPPVPQPQNLIVSAIQSSMARSTALSLLDEIDAELSHEQGEEER